MYYHILNFSEIQGFLPYLDTCEDISFIFTTKSEDIDIFTLATMFALIKCRSA